MADQTQPDAPRDWFRWALICILGGILCLLAYLAITDYRNFKNHRPGAVQTTHEMLNAVIWQKTSAEFEAIASQIYALAGARLEVALQDPAWSAISDQKTPPEGPPAVIMDLDETVIDNTGYEEYLIANKAQYSGKSFQEWCESGKSGAIPGVVSFIAKARALGVQIFFMSARSEAQRACTAASLNRLGIATTGDTSEMILTGGKEKQRHRDAVSKTHRVLLLVGDNLGDFTQGSRQGVEQRRAIARKHQAFWGKKWIILPNPMYGHWEEAFFSIDGGGAPTNKGEVWHKSIRLPN
jgi:5'-nucleotidase (lipoprotein e(P4) family)